MQGWYLKIVELLGDLLASFPDKELLALQNRRLKLLKAEQA